MSRWRQAIPFLVPPGLILLTAWAVVVTAAATPAVTAAPAHRAAARGPAPDRAVAPALPTPASACQVGTAKVADPAALPLGDSLTASLSVTATCGTRMPPVDLVFVVDESWSMTKSNAGGQPGITPSPTDDPAGTPSGKPTNPGNPGAGSQPAWCDMGGGQATTATATPRRKPRRTPTPGSPEETETVEPPGPDDLIRAEKKWVQEFVTRPEVERDLSNDRLRIGFVSFNEIARVKQPLTNEGSTVLQSANRMRGADLTNIAQGLKAADQILNGSGKRTDKDRLQMMVILSDFQFCQRDMRSGTGDVTVLTVGIGRQVTRRNQLNMASKSAYAFDENDLDKLIETYERVLAPPRAITITQMTVRDQLADNMSLVPGSQRPVTATVSGQRIEWPLGPPPHSLSYQVQPQDAGTWPLSAMAEAEWTDSLGLSGKVAFPEVLVEVIPFTATPTPTDTPTPTPTDTATPTATYTATPTPTPVPKPAYLPITFKRWPEPLPTATVCVPEEQTIDVALVVDTSLSMHDPTKTGGQAKIDAAIEAAVELVGLLKPSDQATVIGFNATATVAQPLTADQAALTTALRGLAGTQAQGTAIDAGLGMALGELNGPRHRAANKRSVILVTDGAQTVGDAQAVRDAADAVKAAGITVVTVGLGPEVDEPLLRDVASLPALFFKAPDAEDLVRIYREVARLIPCP